MIKKLVLALALIGLLAIPDLFIAKAAALSAPTLPTVSNLADTADDCTVSFFELKPWYNYMSDELYGSGPHACSVKCFNIFPRTVPNDCGQTRSDIPGMLLAIVDDLLRIAGLVAIGFIIVSSFQFITSRGNADQTARARSTLINAVAGLGIAAIATAFVGFIGSRL